MATNNEVIHEALSLIGVLDEIQSISSEQGENGLSVMNDLLLEWDANGIDTGFYLQTDLNNDCPVYVDVLRVVKYNLAISLSSYYGVEPPQAVVFIAAKGYNRLLRDAMVAKMKEADMTHLPGSYVPFDILSG
jgi:hypothetical protein